MFVLPLFRASGGPQFGQRHVTYEREDKVGKRKFKFAKVLVEMPAKKRFNP